MRSARKVCVTKFGGFFIDNGAFAQGVISERLQSVMDSKRSSLPRSLLYTIYSSLSRQCHPTHLLSSSVDLPELTSLQDLLPPARSQSHDSRRQTSHLPLTLRHHHVFLRRNKNSSSHFSASQQEPFRPLTRHRRSISHQTYLRQI
jgi:hypothetical protein